MFFLFIIFTSFITQQPQSFLVIFLYSRFALDPAGKPIGVSINNACYLAEMEDNEEKVKIIIILEYSEIGHYKMS